jgi:hypothetical protein
LGLKDSKVGRKRRKKIDFDLTLLEGKAKRGGIGLGQVRSKSKKNRKHISSAPKEQKKEESNGKEERADKGSKKVADTL